MSDEHNTNPLRREVPTHLFSFEEKIFGMTLPQLLSDIGGGLVIASITTHIPLVPRIAIGLIAGVIVLMLVHIKVQGYTMLAWLALLARFAAIPKTSVWRPSQHERHKGEPRGIQETWLQLSTLSRGVMGHHIDRKKQQGPDAFYWVAFQVENIQNIRLLPEGEQIRFYQRVKSFLDGLGFPVKLISHVESTNPNTDPAIQAQVRAAKALAQMPRIQQLQQAIIGVQRRNMQACTATHHYIIIAASTHDVAASRPEDAFRSPLRAAFSLLATPKRRRASEAQVLDQLRIRVSIVKKALASLDVRARLLGDAEFLRVFAALLAPGATIPTYCVEVEEPGGEDPEQSGGTAHIVASPTGAGRIETISPAPGSGKHGPWKKRIQALHQSLAYRSDNRGTHLESNLIALSDLVAPSAITMHTDAISIDVQGRQRYTRYFEVTSFASEHECGWQEAFIALGLPLIIMTKVEPLDSRVMIKRLEMHQVKLESSRISDQKHGRISKADQQVEREQVRGVIDALARKKLRVFAVQMIIGVNAGSRERLDQRSDYLLSHLRDMQLTVRPLARRHDVAMQACLPSCMDVGLNHYTNLPSDVLASFINWSTGKIGTPTGAYLGTTGSGWGRQPVYLNPWDPAKKLANPHVTICGGSGMGKSWLVKLIILGLLCNRIADAVVLDRDGDYDRIHNHLGRGESQRFDLAGTIPINLLDIPYGPEDVNLEDKTDLLAEFIDNYLLVGLALLYGETLTNAQEAFLTAAAREAYRRRGITMDAIWRDPNTLLAEPPVFSELIAAMKEIPASSEAVRLPLVERFENVAYLFPGQTSVEIDTPLTIFNINSLHEKWYPLMVYVVQTFLMRHRAIKRDERYLAYVIEEASYLLKHEAGKRALENGSRGYRKKAIAQFTVTQQPDDFIEEGKVILANSATNIFLGMEPHTARKVGLAEELERILIEGVPGRAVMRCGREYAAIDISRGSLLHRWLLTTDPEERLALQKLIQRRTQQAALAS